MFAGSSWQVSLVRRGEVEAHVVEVARIEAHDPTLHDVIEVPLGLDDPAKVLAKITHFAELPPLDGGLGTLRFEVMTKEV